MQLRHTVLYTPVDLPLFNAYTFDEWSEWIDDNDDLKQTKYQYYKEIGSQYPWQRVQVDFDDEGNCTPDLKARFPAFVEHISQLPMHLYRVVIIKQRTFLEAPFHTDQDPDGIGFRVCLAGGQQDRLFKVCGFKPEYWGTKPDVMVNAAPWQRNPYGLISDNAHYKMDYSTFARPSGIYTGVTWAVTSWSGLHAVDYTRVDQPRIQALIMGAKYNEVDELLQRSIKSPHAILLKR